MAARFATFTKTETADDLPGSPAVSRQTVLPGTTDDDPSVGKATGSITVLATFIEGSTQVLAAKATAQLWLFLNGAWSAVGSPVSIAHGIASSSIGFSKLSTDVPAYLQITSIAGYAPTPTGPRSVQVRITPGVAVPATVVATPSSSPFDLRTFGSIAGDGTTDDTAAIQAAIDAAPAGSIIEFGPPKVAYMISATLTVSKQNITFRGHGLASVLRALDASFPLVTVKAAGFRAEAMNFQGAAVDSTTPQVAIFTSSSSPAPRGVLTDCTFSGADGSHACNGGIVLDSAGDWNVQDNVFAQLAGSDDHGSGWGVRLINSNNNVVRGNKLFGSALGGRHLVHLETGSSRNLVTSNVASAPRNSGIRIASTTTSCDANVIAQNVINGVVDTSDTSAGIEVSGRATNNLVMGNAIEDCASNGVIVSTNGATTGSTDSNDVRQNQITRAGRHGISLLGAWASVVEGNTIIDASSGSVGTYDGVHASTDSGGTQCLKVRVRNNQIGSRFDTCAQRTGVYFDPTSGKQPLKSSIRGNDITVGQGTGGVHKLVVFDTATATEVYGNRADVEQTYSARSATPSVLGTEVLTVSNTSPTTITDFTDGLDRQLLQLIFLTANTTVQNNANIQLASSTNFVPTAGSSLTLRRKGWKWYEVARAAA